MSIHPDETVATDDEPVSRVSPPSLLQFAQSGTPQEPRSRLRARRSGRLEHPCGHACLSSKAVACGCRPFASALGPVASVGRRGRCQSSVMTTLTLAWPARRRPAPRGLVEWERVVDEWAEVAGVVNPGSGGPVTPSAACPQSGRLALSARGQRGAGGSGRRRRADIGWSGAGDPEPVYRRGDLAGVRLVVAVEVGRPDVEGRVDRDLADRLPVGGVDSRLLLTGVRVRGAINSGLRVRLRPEVLDVAAKDVAAVGEIGRASCRERV